MAPGDIWEKEGEEKDSSWLAIPIWTIKPRKDSLGFVVFDNSVSREIGGGGVTLNINTYRRQRPPLAMELPTQKGLR